MNEVKVSVVSYGPKRPLMLLYTDPISGKRKTKSAGTTDPDKAERAAAIWETELREGRFAPASKLTWVEFLKRHDEERLAPMPKSTQEAYRVALGHIKKLIDPDRLVKLTPQVISKFQAEARKTGMKETTLHRHLRHIKAALRWAERQGLITKAPTIEMPKLPKGFQGKHRAISEEEFDRLTAAICKTRKTDAPQWERLLTGIWLSGLRLSEALALDWNDGPFVFDTCGKFPRFVIEAVGQKSRRAELAPCTPDFAEWVLKATPVEARNGRVFPIIGQGGKNMGRHEVGQVIVAAGEKAGIIVGETEKVTKGEAGRLVKTPTKLFATAHDLRRSFCTRWAKKVMPPVLQRLARHSNVSTTLNFYACMNADEIAADLWAKHGANYNSFDNNGDNLTTTPQEDFCHKSCVRRDL